MSGFRPIDSKREEFRKYLERAGVMDALTKVLVMLYEEPDKPEDALEYVRSNLGDRRPTVAEVENLRTTLGSAQARIEALEKENQELRQQARSEEASAPLADQLPVSDSDSPSKTPSESPDQPRSD